MNWIHHSDKLEFDSWLWIIEIIIFQLKTKNRKRSDFVHGLRCQTVTGLRICVCSNKFDSQYYLWFARQNKVKHKLISFLWQLFCSSIMQKPAKDVRYPNQFIITFQPFLIVFPNGFYFFWKKYCKSLSMTLENTKCFSSIFFKCHLHSIAFALCIDVLMGWRCHFVLLLFFCFWSRIIWRHP